MANNHENKTTAMSYLGGELESEVVDGHDNTLPPTPLPKIDLHDAHAIRREMATVYRDMRAGRIETQDGTRLVYVLDMIRKAFDSSGLQDRIETLERLLEYRRR